MKLSVNLAIFCIFFVTCVQSKLTMDEKLQKLREVMRAEGYDALVIPPEDEHQSEYVSSYDKRRAWISEFTGSAGTAVVTQDKAALWTDSRYFLQGEQQLDKKYWTLMKSGETGVPSIETWIKQQLTNGQIVGQNEKFTSISGWQSRESELIKGGLIFKSPKKDLIDEVWPADERPAKPSSQIYIHDIKYAGRTWAEKVQLVQARIKNEGADLYVVTALDEIAWLFNLRASDIPYNPMLFAYAIVFANDDKHRLYLNQSRLNDELKQHLNGIHFRDYELITVEVKSLSEANMKIWVSPASSYAIYNSVSNKDLLINNKASPVRSIKAVKTEIELKNFRECQIRDSAARVRHMYWLETELKKGSVITEMTSSDKLEQIQGEDPLFKMPSFNSISAVGENAAVVHYSTKDGKNTTLKTTQVYLLDAGGQYLDCTTDITRTHHFGKPSEKEKLTYTKVLQGSINLNNVVFPENQLFGRELDVEARAPLWRAGLDYGHGTGHGIGYFLSVHESPPNTAYSSRSIYDERFVAGMIQSDEPGYYEDGSFGIRLETDIEAVVYPTTYNFRNRRYLTFDALTLVPFDANLIDNCLLTNTQVKWLNDYNKKIREKVGPRLAKYPEVQTYLNKITEAFKYSSQIPSCPNYIQPVVNPTTTRIYNNSDKIKSFPSIILTVLFLVTNFIYKYLF